MERGVVKVAAPLLPWGEIPQGIGPTAQFVARHAWGQAPQWVPRWGAKAMTWDTKIDMQLAACMACPPMNKSMPDIPMAPWILFHLREYHEPARPCTVATHHLSTKLRRWSIYKYFWGFSLVFRNSFTQALSLFGLWSRNGRDLRRIPSSIRWPYFVLFYFILFCFPGGLILKGDCLIVSSECKGNSGKGLLEGVLK